MIRKPVYSINASKKKRVKDEDDGSDAIEQLKALMGGGGESEKERNHIYFYGDVSPDSCLDLNRKLNNLGKELLKHAIEYDCAPPNIFLHINSNGGCLLSAMSCVDTIRNSRVPIVSIVEGSAASAATIISMVCHRRYITDNSFMLIHQLSTGIYGKYEEIKDDYINDTKFMERLYTLYRTHTKMTNSKIKSVLARDIWWDSQECISNGLADGTWDSGMTSVFVTSLFTPSHFHTQQIQSIQPVKIEDKEDDNENTDIKDIKEKKSKRRKLSS
jgi:ATP-dependent protease ClpP protease subunit